MTNFSGRHALYRLFSADGVLLYVGITNNAARRFAEHAQAHGWWPEVADCKVEFYSDRLSLLDAEATVIRKEKPRHNVKHNQDRPAPAAAGPRIKRTDLDPDLAEVAALVPGVERHLATMAFIETWEQNVAQARAVRDDDLRALAAEHGKAAAARMAGVSLSTIKLAVGRQA